MRIEGSDNLPIKGDGEQRLVVNAHAYGSLAHEVLAGNGAVATVATATPTGVNDCFLLAENNSDKPVVIDALTLTDAGAEALYIQVSPVFVAAGTTAATQRNKYVGSPVSPALDVYYGVDITGHAGGIEIYRESVGAAAVVRWTSADSWLPLVLAPGYALSVFAATGTTAITLIVLDYYAVDMPK